MMLGKFNSEKKFIDQIKKSKYVIIYGAGMVGELIYNRILRYGLDKKVIGFAVTQKQENKEEKEVACLQDAFPCRVCKVPISEIRDLGKYKKDAVVIIATLPDLHKEIGQSLSNLDFQNVVFISSELYQNICQNYISDFKKQHIFSFEENAKMKILFMASDNSHVSGAFRCMAELCGLLRERGVAAAVILPHYGSGAGLLTQKKIPYTYIESKDWGYELKKDHNLLERLKFFIALQQNHKAKRELMQLIRTYSVSLVHCNTTYTYIGAKAAKACGVPYVWHLRENMENQGYRIFAKKKAMRLLEGSAQVIAVSQYIKNLRIFKGWEAIQVVYDAVEKEGASVNSREIFENKTIQMVIVGAITPFKGQKELIKACGILLKRNMTDFRLQIVGKGERSFLEELKKEIESCHLEEKVVFTGTSSNVYELYEKSDIAFTCGAKEAYGRVTIEALLSGCFVIGIRAGATPELIKEGETGVLYEAGNPEELAEKIIQAAKNPELSRRIAKAGQEYANRTYLKENKVREMMGIYEKVLERKRSS